MKKKDALLLFGGTHQQMADAVGLTRSAITQWPEDLRQDQTDRVIGAAIRLGLMPCAGSDEAAHRREQAA